MIAYVVQTCLTGRDDATTHARLDSYPLVYAVQILPLSIARWIGFVQENRGDRKNHVPPTALIAMQVIHLLSGLANVVLFLFTRPNLLLFKKTEDEVNETEKIAGLNGGETDSIEGDILYHERGRGY